MKNKDKKKAICICLAVLICVQVSNVSFGKTSDAVSDSMTDSTAGIEGHLEIVANVKNYYESDEEKEEVLKTMAQTFGVQDGYMIKTEREDLAQRISLTRYFKKAIMSISIADITYAEDENDKVQTIVWELKLEENLDKILEYREKIYRELENLQLTPTSNISLFQNFSGKLSDEKKDRITKTLLSYMEAQVVGEEKEEDRYIVYGYSPKIQESFGYSDEKLNLNIAFEYDKDEDKTYFHLAAPYMKCE